MFTRRYLIECDKDASTALRKHLKRYALRAKVTITDVSDMYSAVAYTTSAGDSDNADSIPLEFVAGGWDPRFLCSDDVSNAPDAGELNDAVKNANAISKSNLEYSHILHRAIVERSNEPASESEVPTERLQAYHLARVRLGLGEGSVDFPVGNCIPSESNLVQRNL